MDSVENALNLTNRKNFVLAQQEQDAKLDMPLSIGFGQTISQPTTVKRMLEWLEVEPGNKILDVGSGSGWTTALLARLTGPAGRVYAVERIPELMEFGRDNCRKEGLKNAAFYLSGKSLGLPRFAPFDRILVSASAQEVPADLTAQLADGGKMVIPVINDILEIEKKSKGEVDITRHHGYVFVPLINED